MEGNVDPEIREAVNTIMAEQEGTPSITYATAQQLSLIESFIRRSSNPIHYAIVRVLDVPYTYKILINGSVYYLNEHQYGYLHNLMRDSQDSDNSSVEASSPLTDEERELLERTVEEAHAEIPVNSNSLLVDEATSRFSSAIWYNEIQQKTIILAGIGGIGSYVAFLLSRMKPRDIYIYDPDVVETANMSGQLYSIEDVGINKVGAVSRMIAKYSNYSHIWAINSRYDETCDATDIMICGFDNMAARKTFFNKWLLHVSTLEDSDKANCLFLDGRLAAEEFQVLCIKGDDEYNINRYQQEFLFSDTEADRTVCSYKQTTFMANMIASVMVNLFVNYVANLCAPLIDRDLPFYTAYNAETMYFKTEM